MGGNNNYTELDLSSHGHSHPGGQNSRTAPNCARCRNHEIIVQLKGHKRYCKYMHCKCDKCILTAERQKVMAKQTAIRRAQEQDRDRLNKGLPVPGREVTPPSTTVTVHDNEVCSPAPASTTAATIASAAAVNSAPSTPRRITTPPPRRQHNAAEMWESILQLLDWCRLPLHTTPLLHIILSEVTPSAPAAFEYSKMWESILQLLDWCRLPLHTTPLLHIILSEVTPSAPAVFEYSRIIVLKLLLFCSSCRNVGIYPAAARLVQIASPHHTSSAHHLVRSHSQCTCSLRIL
ncbi:uncharacterized protein LOC128998339 [Macrosteles quadrilineatus]|uniref:uncharacterized protein LOC128998339 n=1 Tax=Macrosteles quadrilineatus TaxID=74068 RepID=UPI0023E0CD4A|nr:uncharacterized protein LOC128998339 [Macrosteles quadrilineatus]